MTSFNLYITAHRTDYLDYYLDLRKKLSEQFPAVKLHILFSSPRPNIKGEIPKEFHFLLADGFDDRLTNNIDEEIVFDRLDAFSDILPLDLHRSDLRGVLRIRSSEMLSLEQAELSERILEVFEKSPPHLVFVSSGTNILHSITYYIAMAKGAKCYRVHNYLNLNLNLEGERVWFCSNNKMSLSNNPVDKFSYDQSKVKERVSFLHDAVISRLFKLDSISKKFRQRRMPVTYRQIAFDLARVFYYRFPFKSCSEIERLKSNSSINRLRVMINARRNIKLALEPRELSKRYILFALNTPYDSQILVRAPEYRDFISLIELVAGMVPFGYDLVLREHPAFLGMLDHKRLKAVQARHPHVKMASSDAPLPEIIKGATGVLIINNTVFVDAILRGKPVISLGNGYFVGKCLTREVGHLQELRSAFQELINGQLDSDRRQKLVEVMADLFHETYPGPDESRNDKLDTINSGIIQKLTDIDTIYGSLDKFRQALDNCT